MVLINTFISFNMIPINSSLQTGQPATTQQGVLPATGLLLLLLRHGSSPSQARAQVSWPSCRALKTSSPLQLMPLWLVVVDLQHLQKQHQQPWWWLGLSRKQEVQLAAGGVQGRAAAVGAAVAVRGTREAASGR